MVTMAGKKANEWNHRMATEAIHAGEMHDPSGAHIDPVHMTSTYVFEDVGGLLLGDHGSLGIDHVV